MAGKAEGGVVIFSALSQSLFLCFFLSFFLSMGKGEGEDVCPCLGVVNGLLQLSRLVGTCAVSLKQEYCPLFSMGLYALI